MTREVPRGQRRAEPDLLITLVRPLTAAVLTRRSQWLRAISRTSEILPGCGPTLPTWASQQVGSYPG